MYKTDSSQQISHPLNNVGEHRSIRLSIPTLSPANLDPILQSTNKRIRVSQLKIFIRGLKKWTNPETVRSVFSEIGQLSKVKVPFSKTTKKNMGYGCVQFRDWKTGLSLLDNYSHILIDGKEIEISRFDFKQNKCKIKQIPKAQAPPEPSERENEPTEPAERKKILEIQKFNECQRESESRWPFLRSENHLDEQTHRNRTKELIDGHSMMPKVLRKRATGVIIEQKEISLLFAAQPNPSVNRNLLKFEQDDGNNANYWKSRAENPIKKAPSFIIGLNNDTIESRRSNHYQNEGCLNGGNSSYTQIPSSLNPMLNSGQFIFEPLLNDNYRINRNTNTHGEKFRKQNTPFPSSIQHGSNRAKRGAANLPSVFRSGEEEAEESCLPQWTGFPLKNQHLH